MHWSKNFKRIGVPGRIRWAFQSSDLLSPQWTPYNLKYRQRRNTTNRSRDGCAHPVTLMIRSERTASRMWPSVSTPSGLEQWHWWGLCSSGHLRSVQCRRFGTTYQSHLQRSNIQEDSWPLKMGADRLSRNFRQGITTVRCVISQKSADLFCFGAEAWKHATLVFVIIDNLFGLYTV